jgi:Family of unknown function (DUF6455)
LIRIKHLALDGVSVLAQSPEGAVMTWGMSKRLDAKAAAWPMAARVERQARLMGEVMRRVAVDPGAAAREGRGIAFAAASRRCLLCRNFEECREWLDGGGADGSPAFCPNAAFFDRARSAS